MNKKLLIGLGLGLVAYYFLMKRGKGCNCSGSNTPEADPQKIADCEARILEKSKTMRFASPEARDAWKKSEMELCLNEGKKKINMSGIAKR